jgi:hypothetical protein
MSPREVLTFWLDMGAPIAGSFLTETGACAPPTPSHARQLSACVVEVHQLPDRVLGGGLFDDLAVLVVLHPDLAGKAQVGAVSAAAAGSLPGFAGLPFDLA